VEEKKEGAAEGVSVRTLETGGERVDVGKRRCRHNQKGEVVYVCQCNGRSCIVSRSWEVLKVKRGKVEG